MSHFIAERPTWAEISLDNLSFNLRSMKRFIGPEVRVMAVVKADAYGHGAVACAGRLETEGVDWLGVALPEEGYELRKSGIRKPTLCLGGFWTGQEQLILNHKLTPVVFQIEKAAALDRAARERGVVADVHVKIDTGMGRIGVMCDEVPDFAEKMREFRNLRVEGLMSHFSSADSPSENEYTALQTNRFAEALAIFEEKGFRPIYRDLANSPGAVAHPSSRNNLVRLGGVLYGLTGDVLPKGSERPPLRPVLSLHTRIAHLKRVPPGETLGYARTFRTSRESLIATLPIGYHDGLPRRLSNLGHVIVRGRLAPIVGMVSMDWTIIDVTGIPDVALDDGAVVIGRSGESVILAEDIAGATGTISYEITCGLGRRVSRKYA